MKISNIASTSDSATNPAEHSEDPNKEITKIVQENLKANEENPFVALPNEVLQIIFSYLEPKDLGSLGFVCKTLFESCYGDDSLWKSHVMRELDVPLKEGESAFEKYAGAQRFRSNIPRDRFTQKTITFSRKNADPTSRCVAWTVHNNRVYTVTDKNVVEIWDLNTGTKLGQDIPLIRNGLSLEETDVFTLLIGHGRRELLMTEEEKLCVAMDFLVRLDDHLVQSHLYECDLKKGETAFSYLDEKCYFIPSGIDNLGYFFGAPGKFIHFSTLTDWMITSIQGKETQIIDLLPAKDTLYRLYQDGTLSIITANDERQINVKVGDENADEGLSHRRIIFANKDRILIQYEMWKVNGSLKTYKQDLHIISWNPNDGREIVRKKYSEITKYFFKSFSINDRLFLMYLGKFVVMDPQSLGKIGDFKTKLQEFSNQRFLEEHNETSFWISFSHDDYHVFMPKSRKGCDFSIEMYDFTPKSEELEEEEQIEIRQENQELRKRQETYHKMIEQLDKDYDGCLDCCSGILFAFCICFSAVIEDLLTYSWENLCDFIEWANSFFEKEQNDGIVGLNIPLAPIQLGEGTDLSHLPIPPDVS